MRSRGELESILRVWAGLVIGLRLTGARLPILQLGNQGVAREVGRESDQRLRTRSKNLERRVPELRQLPKAKGCVSLIREL